MSLNRSAEAESPQVAPSGVVLGLLRAGPGCQVAQGAVIRTPGGAVELGARSALLENCVAVGTAEQPVSIGQKVVFGHRCVVIGAAVGDLCEIGNGSILLAGARLGRGCILGEGTLVPPGTAVPDDAVVVGRPGRAIRRAGQADRDRLLRLRDVRNDLVESLLAQGLARPDALGMGFATDRDGALLGAARGLLFTLGTLRRGELWESTAIPELRSQASTLAQRLVDDLALPFAAQATM